jgi:hypothetical protein
VLKTRVASELVEEPLLAALLLPSVGSMHAHRNRAAKRMRSMALP